MIFFATYVIGQLVVLKIRHCIGLKNSGEYLNIFGTASFTLIKQSKEREEIDPLRRAPCCRKWNPGVCGYINVADSKYKSEDSCS